MQEKEIYTPMEKILIEGVQRLTTKEVVESAVDTKKKAVQALSLDALLLELEAKVDMMDGLKMEQWLL